MLSLNIFDEEDLPGMETPGKWGLPEDNGVGILTKDNFDQFIQTHEFVFVKFYVRWCYYCKLLYQKYRDLAQIVQDSKLPFAVVSVDMTDDYSLGQKVQIIGFPTLIFFVRGYPVYYKFDHVAREMFQFMMMVQKLDKAQELKTMREFKDVEKTNFAVILFHDSEETQLLNNFKLIPFNFKNVSFYFTRLQQLKDKYEIEGNFGLIIHRLFDDKSKVLNLSPEIKPQQIEGFIRMFQFPLVSDFDQEVSDLLMSQFKPLLVMVTEKDHDQYKELLENIAGKFHGKIMVVKSKRMTGYGDDLSQLLGLEAAEEISFRIVKAIDNNKLAKYKMEDISEKGISQTLQDYLDNKLKPYYKTEPIIEQRAGESVHQISGQMFEQYVTKSKNHVLLLVYAPWCTFSQQFLPKYKQFAQLAREKVKIDFLTMDGTKNEHQTVETQGYPTILLFKKGLKSKPVLYKSERQLRYLLAWLQEELDSSLEISQMAVNNIDQGKDPNDDNIEFDTEEEKKEEKVAEEL